MNMKINVCLVQPSMYIHTMALLEVAIYIADMVKKCGGTVEVQKNRFVDDALNIVIGAHLLPADTFPPQGSVIFNTEQLGNQGAWFKTSHYLEILKRYTVWDYSRHNLGNIPHKNYAIIPFFFSQRLQMIERQPHSRDLVFYGSINERRKSILNQLNWMGERKDVIFGLYGPERDARIAGARAVLNIHHYDTQIFQQVRCFYALTNGIPVITEDYPDESAPAAYRKALFVIPKGTTVSQYIKKQDADGWKAFDKQAREKIAYFRSLDATPDFQAAIEQAFAWAKAGKTPQPAPRKLQLGSGKDYRQGYINVDINPMVGPDIVLNLAENISFPLNFHTAAHGEVCLDEGVLDEIIANDVLEHVPDLVTLMGNCLRLLKVGGVFHISVPYDLSLGAWQDPTHVRGFNQNSWLYFSDWSWYLGWFDYRFQVANSSINLSDLGKTLMQRGVKNTELLNTPRAVDSMRVELIKRATTPEEKQLARAFDGDFFMELDV
jgi:SAM-dependent methyltransferase